MGWIGEERVAAARPSAGPAAEDGESSFMDVARAAMRSAWYVDNATARLSAAEAAYDRASDEIFAATGRRLVNPMRTPEYGAMMFGAGPVSGVDPFAAFETQRDLLAEQHPDKVDRIRPGEPVMDIAREIAREAEAGATSALARYRGFPGTGTLASFAGGFAGTFDDPVNVASLLLGPTGRAQSGIKGLIWMGAKQGAANAAAETASQPFVAQWRREAGLGYDASTFAANVGGAFAFGAGVDVAVRGGYRALQAGRGRVPVLDREGGVTGYETHEAALERAARASEIEALRKAAVGDEAALRELTRQTPLADDPMMRALWEQYDDLKATETRTPGVADAVDDFAALQATRAMLDPAEPPPAPVRPDPQVVYRAGDVLTTDYAAAARQDGPVEVIAVPPERGGDIAADAEGRVTVPDDVAATARPVEPGLAEARQALIDGTLDEHEAAALIRERPEVLDASVVIDTDFLRQARSVARLSDQAFEMVMQGEASPQWGALVHDLVADPARQAGILRALEDLRPDTPADARKAIGVLARETAEPRLVADGGGIDDVHGRDGQAQAEALERQLGLSKESESGQSEVGSGEGVRVAPQREPPIAQFRRDARAIEARLPAAESGLTRLWRGNRPGEIGKNPSFTNDLPGIALPFARQYGGGVSFVDVATARLPDFEAKVGAAPGAEFQLPADLAAKAIAIPDAGAQPAFVPDPPPVMAAMAHPAHPEVSLPVNPDGTVSFWRLGKPHKGEKGNYWTSSVAQVEAYARRAPGREIVRLDVKPEDLGEVVPFGAATGRVREGETFFVIPREMAAGDAKVIGAPQIGEAERAQMRADAAEARRQREPQAGMRVDASGLPETPRSPPAGAPRQSAQDTAAAARTLQGPARKIVAAMRREGVDGVEKAIGEMGPAGMRDAAARLAGDMLRDLADMTPRARAALLGARAMAAVADEMDQIRGGGGGEMRAFARDLEARARAGDVAVSDLGREVTHFERVVRAVEGRGVAAVERELDLMGKAAARDLAERLVPGRLGEWDGLGARAQADLMVRAVLSGRMAMSEAARQSVEGRALSGAAEAGFDVSLRSNLDDADALKLLGEMIRECKL